jgi:serine/threonine-protein kinase
MRILGLITAIAGFVALAADLSLRMLSNSGSRLWILGMLLLLGGLALIFATYVRARRTKAAAPRTTPLPGIETARLLDNFEQRFAELKGRKANETVLRDLYSLAAELETRGRAPQATAVFRHLARTDNTYRDVATRLRRLVEAERATPKIVEPVPASLEPSVVPATDIPASERLGRYHLEREIGRGAMGIVYLGRDMAINRAVAIKAIPLASEFSDSELAEARVRFFREAETAGRLNHPNIVTIYDVGEERGLAYIAMEYLKGHHLSEHAASAKLLQPGKVLDLIGRTAEALGFAHKQQVVHRDIKPANLMYDPGTDILKITDFGIARLTGTGSTRTGIVLGTPSFMSPEQLEGRTVTGRSDLFSLGVSLYQLLTGQLPFAADSMTGLMQQIAEAPHPPLRAIRPDLPACVDSIIDRALAKNPEARFDTGTQMATALHDCRSRMPSGLP